MDYVRYIISLQDTNDYYRREAAHSLFFLWESRHMTRLISDDIADIVEELDAFDAVTQEKTGHTLFEIACHAAGVAAIPRDLADSHPKAGVVPMTCGQGTIEGFAESVAGILGHLGFQAFTTHQSDAAGVAEAFETNADIVMMADDNRFVALVPKTARVIDNAVATGRGFAAALDFMADGLQGKKALVIGCGPVGQSSAEALIHFGASVSVYDVDAGKGEDLIRAMYRSHGVQVVLEHSLERALDGHPFIIEATSSSAIIDENHLTPETRIAAPGMPLGISAAAYEKRRNHIFHDPLQTGVATMGLMAFKIQHSPDRNKENIFHAE